MKNGKWNPPLLLLPLILIAAPFSLAQNSSRSPKTPQHTSCKVGNLNFRCPSYYTYTRMRDLDSSTALFKYKGKVRLYFFVSDPKAPSTVKKLEGLISKLFSPTTFKWKELTDPIMMGMDTKLPREIHSILGYNGKHLVNIKVTSFEWKGKRLLFGYTWDWLDENPSASFSTTADSGDLAPGCNAVASTLNSITHEFSNPNQACNLTGSIN